MMVSGRRKLRQVGLIDRYLARSIAVPLVGSLVLFVVHMLALGLVERRRPLGGTVATPTDAGRQPAGTRA